MLNTDYKVIWRYVNPDKFLFIEGENIFPRFQQFCIASNSKSEILYLLSILNSKIINLLFNKLLKTENEKDVLMGLSVIKEFVRVPKIIEDNQFIKDEVIKMTGEMLKLEEIKLADLVDFKKVLIQKFDGVKVEKNKLILTKGDKEIKLEIKSDVNLVEKVVNNLVSGDKLKLEKKKISLGELKELAVIDFELRNKIKDYIDNLVFALYFNVNIGKVGLGRAKEIKEKCGGSRFYKIINNKK